MSIPRNWRLQSVRYRLMGEACEQCGARIFPSRGLCASCETYDFDVAVFGGRRALFSHSIAFPSRRYDERVTYAVALVPLVAPPTITEHPTTTKLDELPVGVPVAMAGRAAQGR